MAMIKTAISLNDIIYEEINALAKRLRVPRSQLFALAAENFYSGIERRIWCKRLMKP